MMHGETDAVSDVARPEELERTHRLGHLQVLCRGERGSDIDPELHAAASDSEAAAVSNRMSKMVAQGLEPRTSGM